MAIKGRPAQNAGQMIAVGLGHQFALRDEQCEVEPLIGLGLAD